MIQKLIENMEQGTDEWFSARLGIPTASKFGCIVSGTACSDSWRKDKSSYIYELVEDVLYPAPKNYQSEYMQGGTEGESSVVARYELESFKEFDKVGFIFGNEAKDHGASPDGVCYQNGQIIGGIEAKHPKLSTFLKWKDKGGIPNEHKAQVYGSLWMCNNLHGTEWWDFVADPQASDEVRKQVGRLVVTIDLDHEGYKKWSSVFADELPAFIERLNEVRFQNGLPVLGEGESMIVDTTQEAKTSNIEPTGMFE